MAKEAKIISLCTQSLYDAFKNEPLSFCGIVFTDDGDGGTYCDLYNDDGELACMDGEEVYIVDVGEQLVTFRNDNGESSVYFTLTKNELEYSGIGRIWE